MSKSAIHRRAEIIEKYREKFGGGLPLVPGFNEEQIASLLDAAEQAIKSGEELSDDEAFAAMGLNYNTDVDY